jgi:DNA-binding response OmpR family regulator
MTSPQSHILLVEDEELILMIMEDTLTAAGYEVTMARDGQQAWEILESRHTNYDTILLDRLMPRMDGMALLSRLKAHPDFSPIPVIIETSFSDAQSVREGLEQGAYYYLTKPFQPSVMLTVVNAAVEQYHDYRRMQSEVRSAEEPFTLMSEGRFYYHQLDEARMLASFFARACPDPERTVLGLQELLINAVEHGNLAITYAEKTEMMLKDSWRQEVTRRLALPEYRDRRVEVIFERRQNEIRLTIRDQGEGFDWRRYLDFDPARAFDPHGRGIAMAGKLSLDAIEYLGCGNTVIATIHLNAS